MTKVTPGLSWLCWALLRLIDSGQTTTLDEALEHVRAGDVLTWLATLDDGSVARLLSGVQADASYVENVLDVLDRAENAVPPSKVLVEHNGLCLLLGYCLNEMQSSLPA